ncbi:hypothetical protein AB0E27_20140 [Streptomyces sparsogenes]|uniref:hypothetical protein n=1 Tax=Streptomyces sparsogenes TaxID=67365 RepID=UPI0033F98017
MKGIDPTQPPGARRTIAVGVIRPHASSASTGPADRLRSELAYQLGRVYPRYPLTPTALYAAWDRAIQRALPDQTAAAMGPVVASVILSMPRPPATVTCGQYTQMLRDTANRLAVTA